MPLVGISVEEVFRALSFPVDFDDCLWFWPANVEKLLERSITCPLDSCPLRLIRATQRGLSEWLQEVVNASLQEERVPSTLVRDNDDAPFPQENLPGPRWV